MARHPAVEDLAAFFSTDHLSEGSLKDVSAVLGEQVCRYCSHDRFADHAFLPVPS